jgi:hypothetical protein
MRFISVVLLAAAVAAAGGTSVICDDVSTYLSNTVVTDWGGVIYVNDQGELSIINPDYTGEPRSLIVDLGWELVNWGGTGQVIRLSGSSDGRMICYAQYVFLSDEMSAEDGSYIPAPLMVICCGSDGMAPKLLGLSFDAGGGPHFDFTVDSRFVYGSPWLECRPTPGDYIQYVTGDGSSDLDPFLMIDVTNGDRRGDPSVVSDGYVPNPYSDLVAAGWYPPNTIVDVTSGRILLQDTSYTAPAIIETWILPDAGLAMLEDGRQVVRYSDGSETVNPGDRIDVYARLQGGQYVFTRNGGNNVMLGNIDWSDFSSEDAVPVPWLDGLYPGTILHELPGEQGVLYTDGGALILARLP